ncbi:senescence-associated protein [Gossypium australe]|uniref:Senescence-associated protein n=1 Tax=Gossypium australe TaxID=47621 RepID=A0A5B6WRR2_9ROSI|nr:senescence-associated protein [Gossypium australe]
MFTGSARRSTAGNLIGDGGTDVRACGGRGQGPSLALVLGPTAYSMHQGAGVAQCSHTSKVPMAYEATTRPRAQGVGGSCCKREGPGRFGIWAQSAAEDASPDYKSVTDGARFSSWALLSSLTVTRGILKTCPFFRFDSLARFTPGVSSFCLEDVDLDISPHLIGKGTTRPIAPRLGGGERLGCTRTTSSVVYNAFVGCSARQVSTMILPQVHLRKPCYDFSFLYGNLQRGVDFSRCRRQRTAHVAAMQTLHRTIQSVGAIGGVYKGQGRSQRELMTRAY